MKFFPFFICCGMWIHLGLTQAQFAPQKQVSSRECDVHNKEYLVEKFFNLIFTEFRSVPPVCVCVQMCPDQPTYCYPSGCIKPVRVQHKKYGADDGENNDESKLIVDEVGNPFIYVVDGNGGNVLNKFAQLAGKAGIGNAKPHGVSSVLGLMKDRVKILFKYKKLPKVEMRYHLKEHVKHVNMDKLQKDLIFNRSKAIKPRFKWDLTYKKLGKNIPSSLIAAFLMKDKKKTHIISAT